MYRTLKYVRILTIVVLLIGTTTAASAAVQMQTAGGYMPYGYPQTGYPSYGYPPYGGYQSGGCGSSTYGVYPYPNQYPSSYCMQWNPPRWIPVQVTIPGNWQYRLVWIPASTTTLYRPVPGYWQPYNVNGQQPDLSVWQTQNGWYGTPYQSQMGTGFDPYGLWQGSVPTTTPKEK